MSLSINSSSSPSSYNSTKPSQNEISNDQYDTNQSSISRKRKTTSTYSEKEQEVSASEDRAETMLAAKSLKELFPFNSPTEKPRLIDEISEEGHETDSIDHIARESLELAKNNLQKQRYQEAIDESDKGLEAGCKNSALNCNDNDRIAKESIKAADFILGYLIEVIKDKNDSTRFEQAEKLYQDGLAKLNEALLLAKNNDAKMWVIEHISIHANSYGEALFNQNEFQQSESPYLLAMQNSEKAFVLAIKDVDKMRILKHASEYANNYANALYEQEQYLESEKPYLLAMQNSEEAFVLAIKDVDKMIILEDILEYIDNYAIALYKQSENEQSKYLELERIYKKAIEYSLKALQLDEDDKRKIFEYISNCYKNFGNALQLQGKYLDLEMPYKKSIEYSLKALQLDEDDNAKKGAFYSISYCYEMIGTGLFVQDRFDESNDNYKKCIENFEKFSELKIKLDKEKHKDIDNIQSDKINEKRMAIRDKFFKAGKFLIASEWGSSKCPKEISLENMEEGQE